METKIHFLKASHGDSSIIEDSDHDGIPTIIIIDGGLPNSYRRYINPVIDDYTKIDLLCIK